MKKKRIIGAIIIVGLAAGAVWLQQHPASSSSSPFSGNFVFTVNHASYPMKSVLATAQKSPYGADYERIVLSFFAFPLTQENIKSAENGKMDDIKKRIYENDYNHSNASIAITINKKNQEITQADMSVPGYTCTIAGMPNELKAFATHADLKPEHIMLQSKGEYTCVIGTDIIMGWDFNVNLPIFYAPSH